jgi:hypothetical protein
MKLNRNNLRDLIKEALTDPKGSMLLESPVTESTAGSVADRINVPDGFQIGETGRVAKGFIFISADRGDADPEANNANYADMKTRAKSAGFPYIKVEGGWTETDSASGEARPVVERSLLIWDEPRGPHASPPSIPIKQLGMDMSRDYNQESFIYGFLTRDEHGDAHRTIKAYGADGREQGWLDAHEMENVPDDAEYWSRIRHKGPKTQLKEDVIEIEAPDSVIEAMQKAKKNKGKKIKFVRRSR